MKKIALIVAAIMIVVVFAGCVPAAVTQDTAADDTQQDTAAVDTQQDAAAVDTQQDTAADDTQQDAAADDTQEKPAEEESDEIHYSFEFEDINGKVHKLSDYEGKPVYLEIWGSWCGVCIDGLEEMEAWAGEPRDFVVLSVVFPGKSGERSREDFIEWYNEFEYENLIVLLDMEGTILSDFGVRAFPSQLYFDAQGNFVGGQIGQVPNEAIEAVMNGMVNEG